MIALPVLSVVVSMFGPASPTWAHLASTVLPSYALNSLSIALLVLVGVLVGGVGAAWLVTMCRFPGRGWLELALVLPLAMPAYVVAYAYTDLLQFAGPVQSALRAMTGWSHGDYWFPNIRSVGGAAFVFTFVLYPYVYLLARASFLEQSVCALEVSRSLGHGPASTFFRVAVPLARPALAAGAALALMETLADYGAVAYFGVPTFTTGIYRAWVSFGDRAASSQLATMLLGTIMLVLALERISRGRQRFHHTTNRYRDLPAYRLSPLQAGLAILFCALPVLLGFVLPAVSLLDMWLGTGRSLFSARFWAAFLNSVTLAFVAAVIAVSVALFLLMAKRLAPSRPVTLAVNAAGFGYAMPGSVLAVGLLIPLAAFDNAIDAWARESLGFSTGLILSGTMAALIIAYLVRFLPVALQGVGAGLTRVTPHMEDAARVLARGPIHAFTRVHLPVIAPSLVTAGLMVFVDVMKELSATLLLRPFNMETLASQAYSFASDERLAEAALPAIAIVTAVLVPVGLLMRDIARSRPGTVTAAAVPLAAA